MCKLYKCNVQMEDNGICYCISWKVVAGVQQLSDCFIALMKVLHTILNGFVSN